MFSLLLALVGCDDFGISVKDADTATDTGSADSGPGNGGDSGSGGDSGDSGPLPATLTERVDACEGEGPPYGLYFTSASEGWVGCGNAAGFHHTTDGGASFARLDRGGLYVFQIVPDGDALLVCGHDYNSSDRTLLYRYDGAFHSLLRYGQNSADPGAVYFANCGGVATDGRGTLIAANDTSGDISWSTDDGATWVVEQRYWEDANLDPDGYSYYYLLEVGYAGGGFFGGGSRIVEPPVFLGPSTHDDGGVGNFHAWPVDTSIIGEVWAVATPDDGGTFFVGGRDQGRTTEASGFFYRTDDGGRTWANIPLGAELDILDDISFAPDGRHGVAVGSRYPISRGGYVLVTDDGGDTWSLLDADVPLLETCSAFAEGFAVAGDYYLATSSW